MCKCLLCLDPEKDFQRGTKKSEGLTLFEAGVKVLLLLLLLSSFQEILGVYGLVGGGISIHDTHVVNTVRPLRP